MFTKVSNPQCLLLSPHKAEKYYAMLLEGVGASKKHNCLVLLEDNVLYNVRYCQQQILDTLKVFFKERDMTLIWQREEILQDLSTLATHSIITNHLPLDKKEEVIVQINSQTLGDINKFYTFWNILYQYCCNVRL